MGTNIFGIGVSALSAAQYGLVTTEHNIANANTAGFHRQGIEQSSTIPQQTGSGFLGTGVQVDTVNRQYNQFLENQLLQTQSDAGYLSSYYGEVQQIDNLLGDSSSGLSPALQDFFTSVQELSNYPDSISARQGTINQAQALASRFNSIGQRLTDIRSGVNTQLGTIVSQINSYGSQIAALNLQIQQAQSSSNGSQAPNDLLDQRDQLVSDLNKLVKVNTVTQSDGSYNIFIGSGQALVVGQKVFNLSTTQSPLDPDNLVVSYSSGGSSSFILADSALTGGTLGGLMEFRNGILDSAQNSLGRVALGLAQSFNDQHKLGVDLNGNLGGDFFNISSTSPYVKANDNNTSGATLTGSLSSTAVGALTSSTYRLTYNSSGSTYTVTDLTNNTSSTVAAASLSTAIGGISLSISGTPNDGESFYVMPTRYGARDISVGITDTSEVAAATPIKTGAGTSNTGTGQISAGSVTSVSTLPTSTVTLTYDSGTSTFTSSSSQAAYNGLSIAYTSGSAISVNGISFTVTGAPANGDTFTVDPNYGSGFTGVSDNRNALALGALQTTSTLINNSAGTAATATYQNAYSQLVSQVGNKTREYQVRSTAQDALVAQTQQQQQSYSGVNLDEEAANLVRYQQSYQAAGKALQIATTLFDTVLSLGK